MMIVQSIIERKEGNINKKEGVELSQKLRDIFDRFRTKQQRLLDRRLFNGWLSFSRQLGSHGSKVRKKEVVSVKKIAKHRVAELSAP